MRGGRAGDGKGPVANGGDSDGGVVHAPSARAAAPHPEIANQRRRVQAVKPRP